jgi:hypothetical protein
VQDFLGDNPSPTQSAKRMKLLTHAQSSKSSNASSDNKRQTSSGDDHLLRHASSSSSKELLTAAVLDAAVGKPGERSTPSQGKSVFDDNSGNSDNSAYEAYERDYQYGSDDDEDEDAVENERLARAIQASLLQQQQGMKDDQRNPSASINTLPCSPLNTSGGKRNASEISSVIEVPKSDLVGFSLAEVKDAMPVEGNVPKLALAGDCHIRVQVRMPHGSKITEKFFSTESVLRLLGLVADNVSVIL